jgi:hypothetical protein
VRQGGNGKRATDKISTRFSEQPSEDFQRQFENRSREKFLDNVTRNSKTRSRQIALMIHESGVIDPNLWSGKHAMIELFALYSSRISVFDIRIQSLCFT